MCKFTHFLTMIKVIFVLCVINFLKRMIMDPTIQAGVQDLTDKYTTLQGDYSTKVTTANNLATAQHADDLAASAITTDGTAVQQSKDALKALIDSRFPVPPLN